MGRNTGLIVWLSVIAGLSSLSAANVLADMVGTQWSAFFAAVVAACNVGTGVYVAAARPLGQAADDSEPRAA